MNFFHFFTKSNRCIILMFFVVFLFVFSRNILADYMQGSVYKIQSDSVNFGGLNSSSSGYILNDTLGEIGTGNSNSANYYLHAGFWQMQESYISIGDQSDLIMDPMGGLSGGSSEGILSWLVTTDNTAGYTMSIAASTTPALKSAVDSLDDYTPAGADPDYNFINASNSSSFGFSPEGTEANSRFKNDIGGNCNAGALETSAKCWDGFSTTPKVIAGRTTSNIPDGSTVSVRLRAETGVDHIQTSGDYSVTITATVTTL